MKKIINWLKESNRYKHLLGGIGIGIISNTLYCTLLSGIGIASALEFKDKQWGGKWDWIDWTVTVIGTLLGYGVRFGVVNLFI